MAETKPEEMTLVECGFCCSNSEDLQDPRSLPCSHVYCYGCLTSFYETHNLVQCPLQFCRLVAYLPQLAFITPRTCLIFEQTVWLVFYENSHPKKCIGNDVMHVACI